MPVYIVAYDIAEDPKQQDEYKNLYDSLNRMKAYRFQQSVWIVRDNRTAEQIATDLSNHIKSKPKNRLWVSEIAKNTSYLWPANKPNVDAIFENVFDNLSKLAAMDAHSLGQNR